MPDISIDVPLAYPVLERLVSKAHGLDFIDEEMVKNMPQRYKRLK